MIIRALAFAGGLGGAAILSQFPEFSQQYTQRLAGQVEALHMVVADFDRSAAQAGMTREDALASMGGSTFLDARRNDMRETIARSDRLDTNLSALRRASPLERLTMPQRLADRELTAATFDDFEPALPLSVAGAATSVVGFIIGWLCVFLFLNFLAWPFKAPAKRSDGLSFKS